MSPTQDQMQKKHSVGSCEALLSLHPRLKRLKSRLTQVCRRSVETKSPYILDTDVVFDVPKKRKRSESPTSIPTKSPKKPKVYKMELDVPHPSPANWRVTYHAIEEMRKERTAPVDTMGCHVPMLDTRIDQRVSGGPYYKDPCLQH